MKYNILIVLRDKFTLFWTFAFPLLMTMFFYVSFSGFLHRDALEVRVAVSAENPYLAIYESIDIFDVTVLEGDEVMEFDIKSSYEIAYIDAENNLLFNNSGTSQTIVKSVVDQIIQMNVLGLPWSAYSMDMEFTKNANSLDGEQFVKIMFFSLMAMTALQAAYGAIDDISKIQGNLSFLGQRMGIVPTRKSILLLRHMISTFVFISLSLLVNLFFVEFVLDLKLINMWFESLLILSLLNILGIALGLCIGVSNTLKVEVKTGITIGIIMTLNALSGMMGVGLKNMVEEHLPLLDSINPISRFVDFMFSVNISGDASSFGSTVMILSAEILVFGAISLFIMRRRKYDSL